MKTIYTWYKRNLKADILLIRHENPTYISTETSSYNDRAEFRFESHLCPNPCRIWDQGKAGAASNPTYLNNVNAMTQETWPGGESGTHIRRGTKKNETWNVFDASVCQIHNRAVGQCWRVLFWIGWVGSVETLLRQLSTVPPIERRIKYLMMARVNLYLRKFENYDVSRRKIPITVDYEWGLPVIQVNFLAVQHMNC